MCWGVRWRDGVPLNRKLLVEPHLGDLVHAEGTVVTEAGPVTVSWKRAASGALEFSGKIPAGVTAELSLSAGPGKSFMLNGKPAIGKPVGSRWLFTLSVGEFSGVAR